MPLFDYIIVGRGLAGSVLALSLIKENKKILVIDEPTLSSSSKVAAGLFQPMTFKRTVETWKGLESITVATGFYQSAEKLLETEFFFPLNMARIFSSFEEQNNWSLKCDEINFSNLIGENKDTDAESCSHPFGYGSISHAGYLDLPVFLNAVDRYLIFSNSIVHEKFSYDDLLTENEKISYKNFVASKIIFCEGWMIKNNPWFSYIPMKPVKGEVLTIGISDKNISSIISGGLFCVPRKEGDYKVGSNYDWKNLDETPTEKIKQDFKNEISSLLGSDSIFIKSHQAGVRPASHDRRPIVGQHPQYENLLLFNGLGARGVALAPYTTSFLVNHLLNNFPIPDEISTSRFDKIFHLK